MWFHCQAGDRRVDRSGNQMDVTPKPQLNLAEGGEGGRGTDDTVVERKRKESEVK